MVAVSHDLEHPAPEELNLVDVLGALADPGRLASLAVLAAAEELSCGEIGVRAGLDWSKSTISHHLRVLREAGVTQTRVVGAHRLVSLRRQELDDRFPGLLDSVLASSSVPVGG